MAESFLEIERFKLRVLKTISEGGFGIVYLVENENKQGPKMALKKIITQDEERYNIALKELNFLKVYCSQPSNIFISYLGSKVVDESHSKKVFYILIEFGMNGTLFDLMALYMQKQKRFSEEEILILLNAMINCIVGMHSLGVIHCDFKIENLLFFNWESIKLCDFGSVNTYNIDLSTVPKHQFYSFEVLFEKQTTLMYRPPEMCDLYLGYRVNNKVDLWMLGCVLFTLMFFKHPFNESSKLAIVNASYFWPEDSVYSEKLENLTRNLLTPNPDLRPSAFDVRAVLDNWESIESISLNSMAEKIKQESLMMRRNLGGNLSAKNQGAIDSSRRSVKPNNNEDFFDFSGLDRLSKRQSHVNKEADLSRKNNSKKGTSNFMDFNFNEVDKRQSITQSFGEDFNLGNKNQMSNVNFDNLFDEFQVPGNTAQGQNVSISKNFDPFDINFN